MLIAKGEMYGRDVRVIDRWEPTSQTCSSCGEKGGKKELSVREWTCLFCNSIHDRDVNASKNILKVSQCARVLSRRTTAGECRVGLGGFPHEQLAVAEGHSDTKNGHREKVRLSKKKAHLNEMPTHLKYKQLSLF
jgi:putative transposase